MAPNVVIPYFTFSIVICACTIHCTGITFHMHHIVTNKEPVLISICIQYMKCSLFILIDVICYYLCTKSVIMKFKSDIYTAVSRKVVQQNRTRQCREVSWVMEVCGISLRL